MQTMDERAREVVNVWYGGHYLTDPTMFMALERAIAAALRAVEAETLAEARVLIERWCWAYDARSDEALVADYEREVAEVAWDAQSDARFAICAKLQKAEAKIEKAKEALTEIAATDCSASVMAGNAAIVCRNGNPWQIARAALAAMEARDE